MGLMPDPVLHFSRGGYYSVCEMPTDQPAGDITCPRCSRPGVVLSVQDAKTKLASLGYLIHEDGDTFTVTGQASPQPFTDPAAVSVPEAVMEAVKTVGRAVKRSVKRRTKGSQ